VAFNPLLDYATRIGMETPGRSQVRATIFDREKKRSPARAPGFFVFTTRLPIRIDAAHHLPTLSRINSCVRLAAQMVTLAF
jgi:hypothetical protein